MRARTHVCDVRYSLSFTFSTWIPSHLYTIMAIGRGFSSAAWAVKSCLCKWVCFWVLSCFLVLKFAYSCISTPLS